MKAKTNTLCDARAYTTDDQARFAGLSGDFNPIHVDPVRARRELFGNVVVHGMHCVLRGLDSYMIALRKRGIKGVALKKLTGSFLGPIYLNRKVETYLIGEADGEARLQAKYSGQVLIELVVRWIKTAKKPLSGLPSASSPGRQAIPSELSPNELAHCRGKQELYIDPALAKAEFPNLAAFVSFGRMAEMLGLTRLLAMECPGLHSVLSSFDIDFHSSGSIDPCLRYEVTNFDDRFSMVKIAIRSNSVSGTADVFYRPSPQKQPGIYSVRKSVVSGEFAKQRALIIGGSRGLGEVTAKIVASGGGYPVITFRLGAEDANRVAGEVRLFSGRCEVLQCDILEPEKSIASLAKSGYTPSHIYYFATPKIRRNSGRYDKKLFKHFTDFYVDGLLRTYKACREHWHDKLFIFYPSTVMLDKKEAGFAEYAAAKAKGEALCKKLCRQDKKLYILIKRLPRLATDQTATLLGQPAVGALDTMVRVVRGLNSARL